MTTIYQVEDLFKMQDIEKKWEVVREHFESAYKVKFPRRLRDDQILDLYDKWKKLQRSQQTHQMKCAPAWFHK